ncbi:hypothetical protein BAR1_03855 [Profundibacter amoris]|uniref:Uncharacterized protein n=2 Tax=Profundibacter amoris TaxID=2171755 RepID=A0A347UE64_9RHOB|nr:hypothetical protein BAR1_03855 [Profundibacter amoris]
MKAIAEYFRDLSAKDRYFGAEPPALDPEVLANIASRETSLQVEAKVSDNGVHLTPSETSPATSEPQVSAMAEMPAIAPTKNTPDQTKQENAQSTLVVPSSEYDDAQDEALVKTAPAPENPVLKHDTPEPGAESIAAKLRRIRAVVAAKQATSSTSSIFAEDFQPEPESAQKDSAPDEEDEPAGEETQTSPVNEPAQHADATEEPSNEATPSEPEEDDMKISLPGADFSMDDDIEGFDQDDDDMSVANILDVVEDEEEYLEEEAVSKPETDEVEQVDDNQDDTGTEPEEEIAVVHPVRPIRPTVASTQRPEQHNSDPQDTQGETSTDPLNVPDTKTIRNAVKGILGKTSLSNDDESELLTQLASIEVEEATSSTSVSLDRGIDAALRADRANRVMNEEGGAKDEVALERLLEETNAKLDTSESHRRRSAISHLRAAVAATFADRKLDLGDDDGNGDGAEPYRSALADVVQPKTANSYVEPDNSGIAPLVLATDQRVDIENIAKDGLAVVRNTTDDRDELITDSTSFADFAREVGATDLPDLMEAAAAYAAYIEGRPHFARPQIMRQVANYAGKDEFNREEGLRSFGQLLRQGKIVKIRRGQFGIADSTRFKPSTPMAGE